MNKLSSHIAEQKLFEWAAKHPDARSVPPHVMGYIDLIKRYQDVESVKISGRYDPYEIEKIRDDIIESGQARAERREDETRLAEYIEDVSDATGWMPEIKTRTVKGKNKITRAPTLLEIASSLKNCRQSGTIGLLPGGKHIVAWDHKCGQVRLCPDESREETQRLTEWYLPALMDFSAAHNAQRIFYLVPTLHNYRSGDLARGKRELIERWKEFVDMPAYCPITYTETAREGMYKRKIAARKNWPKLLNIRGSLVIQEDPLSAGGKWNVHLNCFVCIHGAFDFSLARLAWGANIHMARIKGDAATLRESLLEAIKYSALIVPSKSAEKLAARSTLAPAMVEWPPEKWVEWWKAQSGFRRVRSYGCLYGLYERRWNALVLPERVKLCAVAGVSARLAGNLWRDIDADPRNALRRAMVSGENLDMDTVQWIGTISFNSGSGYSVDLIPGYNFSGQGAPGGTSTGRWADTGPPG